VWVSGLEDGIVGTRTNGCYLKCLEGKTGGNRWMFLVRFVEEFRRFLIATYPP